MATFSTNQVRHFYVAPYGHGATLTETGNLKGVVTPDKKAFYFQYVSPGGVVRSDLIKVSNVRKVTLKEAENDQTYLRKCTVALDADVNAGAPIIGQDYILRINISQYIGMGDEDTTQKYGAVRAVAGMDASKFYKVLALSLAKNFSREITPLLAFYLDGTEVTADMKLEDLDAVTATELTIAEVEQPYRRGTVEQKRVNFEVFPTEVTYQGLDVKWGTVTEITDTTKLTAIPNSKKVADLEYFCLGERGDQYRMMGYPEVIYTDFVADPNQAIGYSIFTVSYYFEDYGESPQKSEKTMQIATFHNSIDALSTFFTDAGLEVEKIE
jgi:hypothetical protein